MGIKQRDAILEKLHNSGVNFQHDIHDPAVTSKEASVIRGVSMEDGAKSLVVVGEKTGEHYLMVMPGDKRLDSKAIKKLIGERVRFAKDPEVETGCIRGSVAPFGSVFGLKTYVDETMKHFIHCNIGLLTESIKITFEDYKRVEKPTVANLTSNTT